MEVLRNGIWGPVCATGFTWESARVVCRQLGLNGAGTGASLPTSHTLTGGLRCNNNERHLGLCVEIQGLCDRQAVVICG